MAEEKQKEPTQQEKEQQAREKVRAMNLAYLQSEAVNDAYIAAIGSDEKQYGERIKQLTQSNYISALQSQDPTIGGIIGNMMAQSAMGIQGQGGDVYQNQMFSPKAFLGRMSGLYQSAIEGVYVSDLLKLMNIEKVNEANISKENQTKTLKEFYETDKETASIVNMSYLNLVQNQGLAQTMMKTAEFGRKSLESMLQQAPEKEVPKKEEKQN